MTLPNNVFSSDLEESLISCVLRDGSYFSVLNDICTYKDFWFQPYSWVWYAFQELNKRGASIDLITVTDEMQRHGTLEKFATADGKIACAEAIKFIKEKEDVIPESSETYAYQVREDSSKRKIQEVANKINDWTNRGHSSLDILTNIDSECGKIAAYSNIGIKSTIPISDVVTLAMEETDYASKHNVKFIETGIRSLDEKLGGLFPGQLIMIAARSGMGKTALASTIALNVSLHNTFAKKVGIFTLEMKNTEYINRMISALTGIHYLKLKTGKIPNDEMDLYKEATKKLKESNNILIDDTVNITTPMIRNKIRKMREWGSQLIVVDQLGLVNDRIASEPEHLRIDRMSYQFKNMAREFDVPLILIHQMNRSIESAQRATSKEPKMSDLDQSGEKPSDVILMITHETQQKVIKSSKIWIVKNRFGATCTADVKFEAVRTAFRDLTQEELDMMEPDIVK